MVGNAYLFFGEGKQQKKRKVKNKMKNTVMNKIVGMSIMAATMLGCATGEVSPLPDSTTAVLVGLGYKCDKKELQKKGSDLDIASMYETLRYCTSGNAPFVVNDGTYFNYETHYFEPTFKCYCLQDERATRANVINSMKNAMSSDLAIIYFSCKAKQIAATDDTETDGLDECLMLYDGLLVDNEIWDILQTAKGRVFIVFDTGHSETMFRATKDGEFVQENMLVDLVDDIEHQIQPTKNENIDMLCWSACLDSDNIDERSIGSRMTNAFYLKADRWYSYGETFERMLKSVGNKQKLQKTILGKNFEEISMFR